MAKKGSKEETRLPFTRKNYTILGLGLFVIILGLLLLQGGSITLAPILLVIGYCVLIPLGLMAEDKGADSSAGRERLVYTQEVRGSNPLSPKQEGKPGT